MLNETNANDKSIKIKVPKPLVYIVLQNGYCVPKTLSDSIGTLRRFRRSDMLTPHGLAQVRR
jgi:hypothetical protein